MKRVSASLIALSVLSACADNGGQNGDFMREVPEQVIELAAPNQNLSAVTILEEDGCFWYEHVGPVETTLLPLLSTRGRHICTVREEPETA